MKITKLLNNNDTNEIIKSISFEIELKDDDLSKPSNNEDAALKLLEENITLKALIKMQETTINQAINTILKDISMIKTIGMERQEIIQRLEQVVKVLEKSIAVILKLMYLEYQGF